MDKNPMEKTTAINPSSMHPSIHPWRQRLPLILILASFILPAIAAFLLLKLNGWQQLAQTENGILITTPTQLQSLFTARTVEQTDRYQPNNASSPNNDSTHINAKPTWKLLYVSKANCETPCQLALMQLRQVHKALGVEQGRVEQWMLPLAAPTTEFENLINSTFSDLKTSNPISAEQMAWFTQTPAHTQQADITQWVWIVDPLGQVVTAYPTFTDMQQAILAGKQLLKDLRHLLKLSRVG
jgi:hypothetical protein